MELHEIPTKKKTKQNKVHTGKMRKMSRPRGEREEAENKGTREKESKE